MIIITTFLAALPQQVIFICADRYLVYYFMTHYFKHIIIVLLILQSCGYHPDSSKDSKYEGKNETDSLLEVKLQDSNNLTHIKLNFYKSAGGHLYERTIAGREVEGSDTLVDLEYFNGCIPPDLTL